MTKQELEKMSNEDLLTDIFYAASATRSNDPKERHEATKDYNMLKAEILRRMK